MAEPNAKAQQSDLASKLMTDLLTVVQNPGVLPPLEPVGKEGPGLSVGNFTPELKMPALPSAPTPPPDVGTGTRVGRAAAVFLAGMSNPELAGMLVRQFAQQDQLAAEQVQQDFANKMAIVEAGRKEITFAAEQADVEAQREMEGEKLRLAKEQATFNRAQQKIDNAATALSLMHREMELRLRAAEARGDAQNVQDLRLQLELVQQWTNNLKEQVGAVPGEPKPEAMSDIGTQIGILGPEKYMALVKAGKSPAEEIQKQFQEARKVRIEEIKGAARMSQAGQELRSRITDPGVRALFDQVVGALPDVASGDPGAIAQYGRGMAALLGATTDDGEPIDDAARTLVVRQWLAEGRYRTEDEGYRFFARVEKYDIPPEAWEKEGLPAAGTVSQGPSFRSRVGGAILQNLPPVQAAKGFMKGLKGAKEAAKRGD